jgi:hypothetical protein
MFSNYLFLLLLHFLFRFSKCFFEILEIRIKSPMFLFELSVDGMDEIDFVLELKTVGYFLREGLVKSGEFLLDHIFLKSDGLIILGYLQSVLLDLVDAGTGSQLSSLLLLDREVESCPEFLELGLVALGEFANSGVAEVGVRDLDEHAEGLPDPAGHWEVLVDLGRGAFPQQHVEPVAVHEQARVDAVDHRLVQPHVPQEGPVNLELFQAGGAARAGHLQHLVQPTF